MKEVKPITIEGSGGGGKGGGGRAPVESNNTLSSTAIVRILEVLSEGPVLGLSTGDGKSVYFNDTPILNADATVNFAKTEIDVAKHFRYGDPSQTYVDGFSQVETETIVGVPVTTASSVTRTVSNPLATAARVTIQYPKGMTEQDIKTGDLKGSTVQLKIDTKLTSSGTWTEVLSADVTGKTISIYEQAWEIKRAGSNTAGSWDIRVRRITADSSSASINNATNWARFTEIIETQLSYDHTALIGITTDAEATGGQIPTRSYVLKGIKVKYPGNYNPTTRAYTGQWNGIFETEAGWTDNPAWILYDLLTNERYGMGEFVNSSMIDHYSFYDAAVYCDGLVTDAGTYDANGNLVISTEPRFTFNGVIQARDDAIKVIQAVASCMRATVAYYGGLIRINQDRPGTTVQTARKEDVIDGKFNYASSALIQRSTAALITFNDKKEKWLPKIIAVQNTNGIAAYGYNSVELSAFGCTSEGQARRLGNWTVYTNLNQRETCTWRSGFNQQTLILGDIVTIIDDDYGVQRDFRIMSIKLAEANIVEIEAILYDHAKYAYVDLTDLSSPPIFAPPGGTIAPVTNIVWTPYEFTDVNGVITYNLQLEWNPPTSGNPTKYNVQWRKDKGNFVEVTATTAAITIENQIYGTFEARITAIAVNGVFSPVAQSTYIFAAVTGPGGPGTPPTPGTSAIGAPTNLKLAGAQTAWVTEDLEIEWKAPNPIGSAGFIGTLKDFEVTIIDPATSAVKRTVYITGVAAGATANFTYTMTMNRTDNTTPLRSVRVQVRCRDAKNVTGPAITATFSNATPSSIGNVKIYPTLKGFIFVYDMPTDIDYSGTYIWGGLTSGFALSSASLLVDGYGSQLSWEPPKATGNLNTTNGGTIPNTTYYFKLAAYDRLSKPVTGAGLNVVGPFAATSSPEITITSGSVLPTTGNYEGRLFYLTTDGKLYRYFNGAWTAAIPAADVYGGFTAAQQALINIANLTGTITGVQIGPDKITAENILVANLFSKIIAAGTVLADYIGVNTLNGNKVVANSLDASKIIAGSIQADRLMANSIGAGRLNAGWITSDVAFMNSLTAGTIVADTFVVKEAKIQDASVSTLKIKGSAVTIPYAISSGNYALPAYPTWQNVIDMYYYNDDVNEHDATFVGVSSIAVASTYTAIHSTTVIYIQAFNNGVEVLFLNAAFHGGQAWGTAPFAGTIRMYPGNNRIVVRLSYGNTAGGVSGVTTTQTTASLFGAKR